MRIEMPCFWRATTIKTCWLLAVIIVSAPASFVSMMNIAAQGKAMTVAEARRLPAGKVVTLEGTVTVPAGTFKLSISDEGFALEDASGGIYVSMSVNLGLRVGQRVRVTGRLAESNKLLTLSPTETVAVLGVGTKVQPLAVSTGEVGEMTEGRLLKVAGAITKPVVNDPPYGFRLFINDGTGELQIYVSASTGIDVSGLRPGRRVSVTGFGGQYKDHYEVDPRFPADITVLRWMRRPAP
jgi:uncharacterized protein YdeI (BOF family)